MGALKRSVTPSSMASAVELTSGATFATWIVLAAAVVSVPSSHVRRRDTSVRGLEPVLQRGTITLHLCPDRLLDVRSTDEQPARRLAADTHARSAVQRLAEQAHGAAGRAQPAAGENPRRLVLRHFP